MANHRTPVAAVKLNVGGHERPLVICDDGTTWWAKAPPSGAAPKEWQEGGAIPGSEADGTESS